MVFLTGVLLADSFPPFPFHFLVFIAFVPLFVLFETENVPGRVPEDKIFRPIKATVIVLFRVLTLQFIWRPSKRGIKVMRYRRRTISGNAQLFRYTYSIFFLWNLAGSYWLLVAAVRAPELDDTLVLGAAALLALLLAPALMSLPCQLYSRIRHVLTPVVAAGSFIVFWLTFEYLQFNWELSFSWLTLGHSLAYYPAWIQYAEFTGVLGVSFHILVANLLFYRTYRFWDHRKRMPWGRLAIALVWMALPFAVGPLLLNESRPVLQPEARLNVRLVQPSLDPHGEEKLMTAEDKMSLFSELAQSDSLADVDLVILPEKALPRPLARSNAGRDRLLQPLWALVDSHQLDLLTGLESYAGYPTQDSAPAGATPGFAMGDSGRQAAWIATWNSAFLLRRDRALDMYDKGRLAPLVERIPYLEWFGIFNQFFPGWWSGMGNYAKQDSLVLPETSAGFRLGVLLSYESAFGAYARRSTQAGGQAIIIITNNEWWSGTAGYEQHEWYATLRAIENRRSVLRSANLGGSRFVNARGESQELPNSEAAQVADFTIELHSGTTFYAEHGDWIGRMAGWLTLLVIVISLYLNFTPRKRKKRS
ncbi:MAG: apolipoprotein N-acyltransferase [Bacteroidota bacterium]